MKMKPIIFAADDVRGTLEDRKTMFRQVVKPANPFKSRMAQKGGYKQGDGLWIDGYTADSDPNDHIKDYSISCCWIYKPYYIRDYAPYKVGDVLWVKETWAQASDLYGEFPQPIYKAEFSEEDLQEAKIKGFKWQSPVSMPRKAARLFLRVAGVRVERLHDISYGDGEIWAEGIPAMHDAMNEMRTFVLAWDKRNAKHNGGIYSWDRNPWVYAVAFERITKEEAERLKDDENT